MKKPRGINRMFWEGHAYLWADDKTVEVKLNGGNAKECRKLAEWLWNAAAYLDGIEKPKKVKKK